jgi:hypothetical protein
MRIPSGYKPLPGSERPLVSGSVLIAAVEPAEKVAATIRVRARPGAPADRDFDHWQKAPPGQRQFLSAEEYMRTRGSAASDVDAILDFLKSKGIHVLESDPGRRRIIVEGTAAKINAAFAITLNTYRAPRCYVTRPVPTQDGKTKKGQTIEEHIHRGFEGPVHLPHELIEVVAAVIGLDNRQMGGPAATGTGDPPAANYLSPDAVAQLYNFPNTGAAGKTIGIFESAADGAAYLHTDITAFIASLPAGFNTPPNLADIGLTVGATTYTNNAALVTSSPTGGVGECTIDVAIAATVAQGGNINVYFTENSEAGWEAFLTRAILPPAGDNAPSVLTASWLLSFGDDVGSIGDPTVSGSTANVLSGLLQSAATRGITVFMAIGDWGSANQVFDGKCHVSYPNADPWSTACGGTIVGNVTASPTQFEEFVWSDANQFASPFQSFPYVATGGGVSDNFPVPAYQSTAGVLPISNNDGNPRRGVPDVAGMIAMNGFFFAGVGGPGQYGFIGTSLVAPLYAGLVGVIVKWLGRDVGFLNPIFYAHGPEICNDVRLGDNESGNSPPDAPVYTAGPGWDTCTGWGSIEGFRLLAALSPAPIIVTAIADSGDFGNVCVSSHKDEILTINNTGFSLLLIADISSSSPDFVVPAVAAYPLAIAPGGSMDIVIRFQPSGFGASAATLTIFSNDLLAPHTVSVSGSAAAPRLVVAIADDGTFSKTCVGSFSDEPLILNNSGRCILSITSITSSSGEFLVPKSLSYPIWIGSGDSLPLPIRFAPTSIGPKSAILTIASNDPSSPLSIAVDGDVPTGQLAVTGSTCFGGVKACCSAERTISICNVGDCKLHVSKVAFRRKNPHWKLVHNPFPAGLHPGSSLNVVIRYRATEKCPRSCDLVIHSDDPRRPVRVLEVVAYTIWPDCCCRKCCEDCKTGCCEKPHRESCCNRCCDDCNDYDDCDGDKHRDEDGRDDLEREIG